MLCILSRCFLSFPKGYFSGRFAYRRDCLPLLDDEAVSTGTALQGDEVGLGSAGAETEREIDVGVGVLKPVAESFVRNTIAVSIAAYN